MKDFIKKEVAFERVIFFSDAINIAGFWRTHHNAFFYINKMDDRMMFFNIGWLFLIVTLPFATTLVSAHFGEPPAIFLYSMNVFGLSILQNSIWDYADTRNYIDKEKLPDLLGTRFRLVFNLDMINSLVCVILSFFFPTVAFIFLFFKLPMWLFVAFYMAGKRKSHSPKPPVT